MAQRQWRSDDTDQWKEGFGKGALGDLVQNTNEDYTPAVASITGTLGTKAGTIDAASSFADGDIVFIHQTRGTNAGHWELNVITAGGGGTSLTFKYDLTLTYTDSGASQAQIVQFKQYRNITLNSGITWGVKAFDGSINGVMPLLASESITINGAINGKSRGYRGGAASSLGNWAYQGEGTAGAGTAAQAANGNGAGGGKSGTGNAGSHPGGGGGGGGHAAAGANGANASYTGDGGGLLGYGGAAAGSASLVTLVMGGGGGGSGTAFSQCSGNYWASAYAGSAGGAIVILIAPTITISSTGSINLGSDNTSNASHNEGTAGTGAGGAALLKGVDIDVNTTKITASPGTTGTTASRCSSSGGRGGQGSVGRIHADYSNSITGTTTPTIDTTLDTTIVPVVASAGMFLMG